MGTSKNCRNCHSKNCHSKAVPREDLLRGAGRGIRFSSSPKSGFLVALALMLVCLAAPAAAAEELGRLFFTPQQRQDLDRRRATNRAEEEAPQIREGPLTVDGHVERSSGRTATWINGVPEYDDPHSRGNAARVTVVPNAGEPGISLKVGETYERSNGAVSDVLNGGEITVGKPAPEARAPAKRGATAKSPAPAS